MIIDLYMVDDEGLRIITRSKILILIRNNET